MSPIIIWIIVCIVLLAVGLLVGYILRKNIGEKAIGSAEQKARNLILDAEKKSETIKMCIRDSIYIFHRYVHALRCLFRRQVTLHAQVF